MSMILTVYMERIREEQPETTNAALLAHMLATPPERVRKVTEAWNILQGDGPRPMEVRRAEMVQPAAEAAAAPAEPAEEPAIKVVRMQAGESEVRFQVGQYVARVDNGRVGKVAELAAEDDDEVIVRFDGSDGPLLPTKLDDLREATNQEAVSRAPYFGEVKKKRGRRSKAEIEADERAAAAAKANGAAEPGEVEAVIPAPPDEEEDDGEADWEGEPEAPAAPTLEELTQLCSKAAPVIGRPVVAQLVQKQGSGPKLASLSEEGRARVRDDINAAMEKAQKSGKARPISAVR